MKSSKRTQEVRYNHRGQTLWSLIKVVLKVKTLCLQLSEVVPKLEAVLQRLWIFKKWLESLRIAVTWRDWQPLVSHTIHWLRNYFSSVCLRAWNQHLMWAKNTKSVAFSARAALARCVSASIFRQASLVRLKPLARSILVSIKSWSISWNRNWMYCRRLIIRT